MEHIKDLINTRDRLMTEIVNLQQQAYNLRKSLQPINREIVEICKIKPELSKLFKAQSSTNWTTYKERHQAVSDHLKL